MLRARVLDVPPVSGSVPEAWFSALGNATWVLFETDAADTWAGVFGQGDFGGNLVILFADGETALVLAKGKVYVVDTARRACMFQAAHNLLSAVSVPERDFVIVADSFSVSAVNRAGVLWQIELADDGIILDEAGPDEVHGKAWQVDGWYAFTLRYDGPVLASRKFLSADWEAFMNPST